MIPRPFLSLLAPALLSASPAMAAADQTGPCIRAGDIQDTQVIDDRTIDFLMQGHAPVLYRNILPDQCPLLGIEKSFVYETHGGRLCRLDRISVLSSGVPLPGSQCILGDFVRLPAEPAK